MSFAPCAGREAPSRTGVHWEPLPPASAVQGGPALLLPGCKPWSVHHGSLTLNLSEHRRILNVVCMVPWDLAVAPASFPQSSPIQCNASSQNCCIGEINRKYYNRGSPHIPFLSFTYHSHTQTHTCANMHSYTNTYMYMSTCTCTHTNISSHTDTHMCTHVCAHMCNCMYTCLCTHLGFPCKENCIYP